LGDLVDCSAGSRFSVPVQGGEGFFADWEVLACVVGGQSGERGSGFCCAPRSDWVGVPFHVWGGCESSECSDGGPALVDLVVIDLDDSQVLGKVCFH
jgi:hypothetical protein